MTSFMEVVDLDPTSTVEDVFSVFMNALKSARKGDPTVAAAANEISVTSM